MNVFLSWLNEQQRRWFVALEGTHRAWRLERLAQMDRFERQHDSPLVGAS